MFVYYETIPREQAHLKCEGAVLGSEENVNLML